ncbi:TfoX/Sxy family protein [Litorivivens sp.]|uniref:TfoX/Sxy family protein n=1 Tax=Litorivivens sp. TaxID=2020868 RepID=UPI003565DCB8
MPTNFADWVVAQMGGLGVVEQRPLFGGVGLFRESEMFALVVQERLYFRADKETRFLFEHRGLPRYVYKQGGVSFSLDYFQAPAEVFLSQAEMLVWSERALRSAYRSHSSLVA